MNGRRIFKGSYPTQHLLPETNGGVYHGLLGAETNVRLWFRSRMVLKSGMSHGGVLQINVNVLTLLNGLNRIYLGLLQLGEM